MGILRTSRKIRILSPIIPILESLDQIVSGHRRRESIQHARPHFVASGKIGLSILAALEASNNHLSSPTRRSISIIERERTRLLNDSSPLLSKSDLKAGPYDTDQTVASACAASKPPRSALLLYQLVRALKPTSVIELGTNVGISSAFMATGLRDNDEQGAIVTLDASPQRLQVARTVHMDLGLTNIRYVKGLFSDTLSPTLDDMPAPDFAFIDGHHQYKPTLDYFSLIASVAQPNAAILFDDIRWSDGMWRAWLDLRQDQRFSLTVDLGPIGIGILRKEGNPPIQPRQIPRIHCL